MAGTDDAKQERSNTFLGFLKIEFNDKYNLQLPLGQTFDSKDAAGKCRRKLHYFYTRFDDGAIRQSQLFLDKTPKKTAAALLQHFTSSRGSILSSYSSSRSSSTRSGSFSTATDSSSRLSKGSHAPSANPSTPTSFASASAVPSSSRKYAPDPHMSLVNSLDQGSNRRIDFRLFNMPKAGFFHSDIPRIHHQLPLHIRYELQRLVCHYDMPFPMFLPRDQNTWNSAESTYKALVSLVSKDNPRSEVFPRTSEQVWDLATSEDWPPELSMSAALEPQRVTSKSASVFKLRLNTLHYNPMSNRFFRKFGSHRFLKVMVPSAADIQEGTAAGFSRAVIEEQIMEWLNEPGKQLLGMHWVAFYNKPDKSTQKQRKRYGRDNRREVMFFAESGPNLEPLSRVDVFNWFMDMDLNAELSACKAFARLEMGFSTTYATIGFNPGQVLRVDDLHGNGANELEYLRDTSFDWSGVLNPSKPRVMTDGCCTLSKAAAQMIWEVYLKEDDVVPSLFQGRIGPWKGVWFVESNSDADSDDIWIKVCPSQQKFTPHIEDEGEGYDPFRLTLEVLEWSRKLSNSKLHIEHLPILEDRGVMREYFENLVTAALQREKTKVWEALTDSFSFLEWMARNTDGGHDLDEATTWSGPRQKSPSDMARSLIQSGFDLKKCETLADSAKTIVQWYFKDLSEGLNLPIEQSTSAIGVADPFRCLAPDEIFLSFSDCDLAGSPILDRCDALVTRHPALRASDVQRVRIVFKPELMHLRDAVVFPTTGSFPLAGKLQGGDYDGDRFWICWDKALVANFRNAPPPAEEPRPEDFGIEVDRTKCADMLQLQDDLCTFFKKNFRFQWEDNMLGQVTVYHEELRYNEGPGSMHGDKVRSMADIHDLIIDTAKNGYSFSYSTWLKIRARLGGPQPVPLYKRPDQYKPNHPQYRKCRSVVDFLMFGLVRPFCQQHSDEIARHCELACERNDADLEQLAEDIMERYRDQPDLSKGLIALQKAINPPDAVWTPYWRALMSKKVTPDDGDEDIRLRRQEKSVKEQAFVNWYRDLCAEHIRKPAFRQWLDPVGKEGFTTWDQIKASFLHRHWPKKSKHMFTLAGSVLCHLKAHKFQGTEPVIAPIRARLRFKNLKRSAENRDDKPEPRRTIVPADVSPDVSGYAPIVDPAEANPYHFTCSATIATADGKTIGPNDSVYSVATSAEEQRGKRARPNGASRLQNEVFAEEADISFEYPSTEVDTQPETDYEDAIETARAAGAEVESLSQGYSHLDIDGRDLDVGCTSA